MNQFNADEWNIVKIKLAQQYPQFTAEDFPFDAGTGTEAKLIETIHGRIGGDRQTLQRGIRQILGTNS